MLDSKLSKLCTFSTTFGRYKFNRLPFGICCASDAAQTMVEKVFRDIRGVLVIHDDLIIVFKTSDEHDKTLTKVFDRARERNIKFNKKKIQFKVSEVKYLDHIMTKQVHGQILIKSKPFKKCQHQKINKNLNVS